MIRNLAMLTLTTLQRNLTNTSELRQQLGYFSFRFCKILHKKKFTRTRKITTTNCVGLTIPILDFRFLKNVEKFISQPASA